jgi:hypothetical protein
MVPRRLIEKGERLCAGKDQQGKKWPEMAGNTMDEVGGEGAEEGDESGVCETNRGMTTIGVVFIR